MLFTAGFPKAKHPYLCRKEQATFQGQFTQVLSGCLQPCNLKFSQRSRTLSRYAPVVATLFRFPQICSCFLLTDVKVTMIFSNLFILPMESERIRLYSHRNALLLPKNRLHGRLKLLNKNIEKFTPLPSINFFFLIQMSIALKCYFLQLDQYFSNYTWNSISITWPYVYICTLR